MTDMNLALNTAFHSIAIRLVVGLLAVAAMSLALHARLYWLEVKGREL